MHFLVLMIPTLRHSLSTYSLHVSSRGVFNRWTGFSTEMLNWKQKWVIWPKIRLLPGHCLVLFLNPGWSLGTGLWSLHVLPITRATNSWVVRFLGYSMAQSAEPSRDDWGVGGMPLENCKASWVTSDKMCTGYPSWATQDLGQGLHFQAAKWQLANYTNLETWKGLVCHQQ